MFGVLRLAVSTVLCLGDINREPEHLAIYRLSQIQKPGHTRHPLPKLPEQGHTATVTL